MAKVTVEVLDAIVDGKKKGEKLELDQKQAKQLEAIRYVKIVKDEPKKQAKKDK